MTVDEAKGLFALMNWPWEPRALADGNRQRGIMPEPWRGRYEVHVNEVMVAANKRDGHGYTEYERYDIDACLTRYAELYVDWIAQGRPLS